MLVHDLHPVTPVASTSAPPASHLDRGAASSEKILSNFQLFSADSFLRGGTFVIVLPPAWIEVLPATSKK